jgi:hypothetical protein
MPCHARRTSGGSATRRSCQAAGLYPPSKHGQSRNGTGSPVGTRLKLLLPDEIRQGQADQLPFRRADAHRFASTNGADAQPGQWKNGDARPPHADDPHPLATAEVVAPPVLLGTRGRYGKDGHPASDAEVTAGLPADTRPGFRRDRAGAGSRAGLRSFCNARAALQGGGC